MKTYPTFAAITVSALSAFTLFDSLNPRWVEAQTSIDNRVDYSICEAVTGTYLATLSQDGAIRSIITLTQDGNIFIVDSIQGGIKGELNPFSDTRGTWTCTGDREITATVLNFSYPGDRGPGNIARGDFHATFDPQAQAVEGTIAIRFFDLDANPLESDSPVLGTYTFTGQRVMTN